MGEKARGNLVIIGGHEDKDGKCLILRKVVELAGGSDARLVIMTTAALDGEATGSHYRQIFTRLGAGEVEVTHINTREEANDPQVGPLLEKATGVFFTGGDQLRITSTLGGTVAYDLLHHRYEEGMPIAGTSAGASAMSDTMIVQGSGDDAPKRNTTKMAPGMGLLEEVVIDQHFAQRGRIGRLLSAVAQNPYVLGVGIDEDTAILVSPEAKFEVIGSQTVTVIDGRDLEHSNASESVPDQPLALARVILHILPSGYRFDLKARRPIWPTKSLRA